MAGVIVLSLSGVVVSLIVLSSIIKKLFQVNLVIRLFNTLEKYDLIIAIGFLVIGIWNLFSPNFGVKTDILGADLPILGALIPSSLVILSSLGIGMNYFLQYVNISSEIKDKLIKIKNNYNDIVGVSTLIFSFLHLFTYQVIFL